MNTFFVSVAIALLERTIRSLMDIDWKIVQQTVINWMDSDISGEEKRKLVFAQLRDAGCSVATWLLNAAIEIAYGRIKTDLEAKK